MNDEINVMVLCPKCHTRLFDKVTLASGKIKIKCPRCKEMIDIDLAFRLNRRRSYSSYQNRVGL